jgi:hypothetical protein
LIPDSLKENAYLIIREYNKEIELSGVNAGKEKIKKVVTFLDNNSDKHAVFHVVYDMNSKVKIHQITVYNKDGKEVKRVKRSDIIDIPYLKTIHYFQIT